MTVRVRCVDPNATPHPRVLIDTGQECLSGETIDVDDDLAGSPPSGTPGEEGYDPGAGLLAQVGVWEPAEPSAAARTQEGD